ncbi:hypothetical protein V6N13_040955 [Hibiscus sabdariffa]|uniref:Uncharacterized protein n=1 Tax=Hibiscus sabdariffa TaxID=183260 RepID=A0ABR2RAF0_9ROSI
MEMDFTMILPEECQSLIMSFTSPADACRSAMVDNALRSAVDFDAVWEKFLPSDYKSIILGSSSSSSSWLLSLGKKDLYLKLCFDPILLQNGTMSFQLEKGSGKKCYMLGARELAVIWGNTPAYWNWTSQPDSRFPEVAELEEVWWLDVTGKIKTRILSSDTNYAVYLVFRLRDTDATGFRRRTVGLHVNVDGIAVVEVRRVSLDPRDESQHVRERRDGRMEVEMGEFFNDCGDNGTVEFSMKDLDTNYRK